MDYKTLMGYGNKKNKKSKPKQNKIVENIKSELNEWSDNTFKTLPKRWSGALDTGLTEYEKQKVNEGVGTRDGVCCHDCKIENIINDIFRGE